MYGRHLSDHAGRMMLVWLVLCVVRLAGAGEEVLS